MRIVSFTPTNEAKQQSANLGLLVGDTVRGFPEGITLEGLLTIPKDDLLSTCKDHEGWVGYAVSDVSFQSLPAAPIWAAGVTYKRSQVARMEESSQKDVYDKVYEAERPEIFLKSMGSARANGEAITVRSDSSWDVPEPELTLVINSHQEVIGYTIGNDVSSREIEGENPLYLPQAKIWTGSAAIGPAIRLATPELNPLALTIRLQIERDGKTIFEGSTATDQIHRKLDDLVDWLHRGSQFSAGVYLMTGTGIVPPDEVTLVGGDTVRITIDEIGTLTNVVRVLDVLSHSEIDEKV